MAAAIVGCSQLGSPSGAGGLRVRQKIEFDDSRGNEFLKLEPDEKEIELQTASGKKIASIKLRDGTIRLKNGGGQKVASIVLVPGEYVGLRVSKPDQGDLLFKYGKEPDGDFKLENERGITLYKLKKRAYGYKIEDGNEKILYRVRARDSKTSMRDASGKTVLSTRNPIPAAAAACLTFAKVPVEIRAGLCVAVIHWGLD